MFIGDDTKSVNQQHAFDVLNLETGTLRSYQWQDLS